MTRLEYGGKVPWKGNGAEEPEEFNMTRRFAREHPHVPTVGAGLSADRNGKPANARHLRRSRCRTRLAALQAYSRIHSSPVLVLP
ncbi:hypothetical protein [Cupriavidus yeoncheonensis]|uniref:hypothetical protein n=1 Tax=Cupriavidus yeoncheonensis TaxID=1462994 RepID=UPI001BA525DE|nr:hypothetical protein [Cupriavidus yeoncheonensis]